MDYKEKYIELNRALTNLKRGKPSDHDLEVLNCPIDEFHKTNQYLVANSFNVKERAAFIKSLEKSGVDLFDAYYIKDCLDMIRHKLEKFPDDNYLIMSEIILGNLLYNKHKGIETIYNYTCKKGVVT